MATSPNAYSGSVTLPSPSSELFNGGLFDYNDAATATTPISVTGGAGFVILTNDELGPFTNKTYAPDGVTDIWNASTNRFDWTQLKLGDMVDIRIDLEITTSAPNTGVEVSLAMAYGDAGQYEIPFFNSQYKNAAAYNLNRFNGVYMGDTLTLSNPAVFRIKADANCTVLVRGWYCKIVRRG